MTKYPHKDRDARTGSSLRGQPLLAYRQAQLARDARPHERLAKEYYRQSRKLFSKADLRRAAEIAAEANREWREASIKSGNRQLFSSLRVAIRPPPRAAP